MCVHDWDPYIKDGAIKKAARRRPKDLKICDEV